MRNKKLIILFILLLVLVTGCDGKKEKRNTSGVEVIKSVEPYDQQLNCSKDITEQVAVNGNVRLVNYLEMSFLSNNLQEYSIIYDVTFGDTYSTSDISNVVAQLEENFLSLYNINNDKVIISTREIAPKRYNIKTFISYKHLTKEEREQINMVDIGSYDTNLRAFENSGYICQTSV